MLGSRGNWLDVLRGEGILQTYTGFGRTALMMRQLGQSSSRPVPPFNLWHCRAILDGTYLRGIYKLKSNP